MWKLYRKKMAEITISDMGTNLAVWSSVPIYKFNRYNVDYNFRVCQKLKFVNVFIPNNSIYISLKDEEIWKNSRKFWPSANFHIFSLK